MTSPAMSAVTGKVLSADNRAGYAADWALFTDWCAATGHIPLPAGWATVTEFTAGCAERWNTNDIDLLAIRVASSSG